MKKRPIIDAAYDLLANHNGLLEFPKLWDLVCNSEGLSSMQREDLIADFYTDLSVDARFVNLGENRWDLRSRHLFNEVYIDTDAILVDDSEELEIENEIEDETEVKSKKEEEEE